MVKLILARVDIGDQAAPSSSNCPSSLSPLSHPLPLPLPHAYIEADEKYSLSFLYVVKLGAWHTPCHAWYRLFAQLQVLRR